MLLDRYAEMTGPDRSAADALFLAEVLAPSLGFLRRTEASDALLADLDADLRARGAVRPLISVLGAVSVVQYGRSFPADDGRRHRGHRAWPRATRRRSWPRWPPASWRCARRRWAIVTACEQAAALLRDVPEPERRAMGPIGLGYLALNQGRLDDADAHYRVVHAMSPIGKGLVRWEPEWVETLIRAGRRDEAVLILDELEGAVAPELLIPNGLGRPKGMLAVDDDEAAEHFNATIVGGGGGRATGSARGARRSSGASGCGAPGVAPRPGCTSSAPSRCCAASAPRSSPSGRRPSCGPPAASSARTPPRTSC